MELFNYLDPHLTKGSVVTLAGGGGKTHTIYALARSAALRGLSCLVTTTTMMIDPAADPSARGVRVRYGSTLRELRHPERGSSPDRNGILPPLFAATERLPEAGKVRGLDPGDIDLIAPFWDLILVEGDGAKHRPVKAPAEHEPVIPSSTGILLGCIGLDCIGKPLGPEHVHRPELFGKITGLGMDETVDERALGHLVENPLGLFKGIPPGARAVVALNKADLLEEERVRQLVAYLRTMRPGFFTSDSSRPEVIALWMQAEEREAQLLPLF